MLYKILFNFINKVIFLLSGFYEICIILFYYNRMCEKSHILFGTFMEYPIFQLLNILQTKIGIHYYYLGVLGQS